MKSVRLLDGCFPHELSATLAGENSGSSPVFVRWCRDKCDSLFTWYTDTNLWRAEADFHPERIGWLIEPPALSYTHYQVAHHSRHKFRKIFTYNRFLLDQVGAPYEFYPLGGSWINPDYWGMYEKHHNVSIIASPKRDSEGHKLRHEIIKQYPQIHSYGNNYAHFESKREALGTYRYAVIVESWRGDWYFSEKLIDCLSVGTIPIYWGCPDIGKFFDIEGILQFKKIEELWGILRWIGEEDYLRRLKSVKKNLDEAGRYRIADDWLFREYPRYFR